MEVLCEKTVKILGFWATVGDAGLEHEGDEMRKEKGTKTNIGIWRKLKKREKKYWFDWLLKKYFGELGWKSWDKWKVNVKIKKIMIINEVWTDTI